MLLFQHVPACLYPTCPAFPSFILPPNLLPLLGHHYPSLVVSLLLVPPSSPSPWSELLLSSLLFMKIVVFCLLHLLFTILGVWLLWLASSGGSGLSSPSILRAKRQVGCESGHPSIQIEVAPDFQGKCSENGQHQNGHL